MVRPISLLAFLSLLSFFSFLLLLQSPSSAVADSQFEGFDADDDDAIEEPLDPSSFKLNDLPLTQTESLSTSDPNPSSASDHPNSKPASTESDVSKSKTDSPSTTTFSLDYWDEDEFEGLPT